MFWSRFDEAKTETLNAVKESPYKTSKQIQRENEINNTATIMEKMSEYLFDLFDANCMDEYKLIEDFENKALLSFQDFQSEEFTFEQQKLHNEFLELFEQLLEGFLKQENITISQFYDDVHDHLEFSEKPTDDNKYIAANEITDIILYYTTFEKWAEMMKETSKHRSEFIPFSQQVQEAITNDATLAVSFNSQNKSTTHRFEDELLSK